KERRQSCETVQTLGAEHPLKYLPHSAGIPKSSYIGKAGPDAAAKTAVGEVCHRRKGRKMVAHMLDQAFCRDLCKTLP
ncbi:hypothetical protein ACFPVS_03665, partial [Neisseria weixii]